MQKIILASKSPRRKLLLEQIGIKNFEIIESSYEEDMQAFSEPRKLAKFLALKKAEDIVNKIDDGIVISGDTFVVFEGKFLGKPKNKQEAFSMLKSFSEKELDCISGFAVIDKKTGKIFNDIGEAKLKFKKLSDQEIWDYIESGEPMDKAGSFGIANTGAVFIEKISGDYYSIVAFPINKIYDALRELGVKVF